MKSSDRTHLMHTVLDGEATAEESLALERLLATDPAARTEHAELCQLFDALSGVPKAFPPEGLVASVMDRLPRQPAHPAHLDQLSARPGVIGLSSKKPRFSRNQQGPSGSRRALLQE
jgi:anti-sigma factor RsiW